MYLREEGETCKHRENQPHGLKRKGETRKGRNFRHHLTLRIAQSFISHVSDHEEHDHSKVDTFFHAEHFQPELLPLQLERLADHRVLERGVVTLECPSDRADRNDLPIAPLLIRWASGELHGSLSRSGSP
eukprot:758057-Hanusia_phi.AAC.2